MSKNGRFLVVAIWVIYILCIVGWVRASALSETMYVQCTKDWVNGRTKPNVDSSVECRFFDGFDVTVLEIADGWAKVDEGGEAGFCYVSLDYLTSNADGSDFEMIVSANGPVNICNKPDGKKVIGELRDGDVINVAFLFDGWAKVGKGWVDADFLIKSEALSLEVEDE